MQYFTECECGDHIKYGIQIAIIKSPHKPAADNYNNLLAVNLEAWSSAGEICAYLGTKAMHLFFDMSEFINLATVNALSEGAVKSGMATEIIFSHNVFHVLSTIHISG